MAALQLLTVGIANNKFFNSVDSSFNFDRQIFKFKKKKITNFLIQWIVVSILIVKFLNLRILTNILVGIIILINNNNSEV